MQAPGLKNTTSPAANKYVLVVAGKPQGPFSIEELKNQKIKPGDFVKTPDMDDYKRSP
jgi:BRCT domain type II-containing protein